MTIKHIVNHVFKISIYNLAALELVDLAEQGANYDDLLAMNGATLKPAIADLSKQAQEQKDVNMAKLTAGEANLREMSDYTFRMNLAVGGIVTFLGVMVAVFITRQVTNPLNALHEGTEIIGTGNLNYKVGTKAKDEIGQLSRAFDNMTERLSSSLVSIDNLNEEISGREKMEQALRQSERKLKHIFEAAGDGITVTDLNGNIIEANDNLARMVGLKHARDLIGKNTMDFIPPHEFERAMAHLQGIPSQHSVVVAELDLRKANGSEFPVEINSSVMKDSSGKIIGQVAILRDISKRKRMEQDLNERLKELNCLYGIAKTAQKSRITLDRIYEEIVSLLP